MAASNETRNGWYTTTCEECIFTLPVRYQRLTFLGRGVYGIVVRAKDTETGKYVAIKKLLQPFQTPTHAKRAYRELKLLIELNHPDANVVQLYNVFTDANTFNEFQTLYLVLNYCNFNLHQLVEQRKPFNEDHIRLIIYSLLRGVKFINSAGVIHRDLKPMNIGSDKDTNIAILDFGLARTASNGIQTGYVATRWWRAPEVFISWEQYDAKIDIWSVGCIMAELILLTPIFKGTDHIDQLNKMFDVIGTPDSQTLDEVCTEAPRQFISGFPPKAKQDYNQLFGYKYNSDHTIKSGVSPEGIDLLDSLLSFDPRRRPTAEVALAHPFLKKYHDGTEEPSRSLLVDPHQDYEYDVKTWKTLIWQMIQEFEPPMWINNHGEN